MLQAFPREFVEKVGTRAKKKIIKGERVEEKETLARKTHDFDKLRSLTNAASDWCGAGSVDYLALETSINQSIFNLQSVRKAKSKNNK